MFAYSQYVALHDQFLGLEVGGKRELLIIGTDFILR